MTEPASESGPPTVEASLLWACGYYDGPLDGICLAEERICWFQVIGDPMTDDRMFAVYEMTDADARVQVTQHFLFEQYVGIHTCTHASLDGKRPVGQVRPAAEQARFYEAHHPEFRPTDAHEPIGTWDYYGVLSDGPDGGSDG